MFMTLRIPLLLFLFLGLSTVAIGQTKSPTVSNDLVAQVDFCQVLRDPRSFVGKTLKINATYTAGFEMGWLEYPPTCDIPNAERFAIRDVWDKGFETRSQAKVVKKFNKFLKERNKKTNYVGRVSGLFEIQVREFEKRNLNDTRYQYDFVVLKVLSAEKPLKK